MLKNKQPMPVNIRATMQQQQQLASARNRRLAQQMENRPSVQAALKLKQKSLKQRLGKSNIQARLGRPAGALARGAMGGRGLAMGQRGLPRGAMRGGRGARALLRGGVPLRGQSLLRGGRGMSPRMGLRRGGIRGRGGPGRGGLGRGAMGRGGLGGRGCMKYVGWNTDVWWEHQPNALVGPVSVGAQADAYQEAADPLTTLACSFSFSF